VTADDFLPVDYARRFADETARATLVLLDAVRHFLYDDEPQRCADEMIAFLDEAGI
jgi:haloalkane dehalogenase